MLVNLYEISVGSGMWYVKDVGNVEWSVAIPVGIMPLEEVGVGDKSRLKQVIKLKGEGFTSDEIIELFNAKVL